MKTANVFVVHTPFQAFAAQHMLRQMPEFTGVFNRMVLASSRVEQSRVDRVLWDNIQRVSPAAIERFTPERMRYATRCAQQALAGLERFGRVNVYVSNIDALLPNALVSMVHNDRARLQLHSYPEGLGTLVPCCHTARKRLKTVAKHCWGRLLGIPYYNYRDDFAGLEQAERIYSFAPELLPHYGDKVVRIPQVRHSEIKAQPGWLVLGQPRWPRMPVSVYENLFDELRDYALGHPMNTMLYKTHHCENGNIAFRFAAAGFQILEDTRPVEEIFLQRPVSHVLGVGSSALLHLKLFYGDNVQCVSFHTAAVLPYGSDTTKRHENVAAAFRRYGVAMVD
ncbi:MAG: hypothetical protein ACE14M_12900 [Terriglobales bacterium]